MLRGLHHFSFIPDTLHLKISQNIREILIFCWVIGIFLTFLVPPFQKPDESSHFFRAISVAQGNLICSRGSDGVFQNTIPQYLRDFPEAMYEQHIAANPRAAFSKQLYLQTALEDTFPYNFVNEPTSCSLPFLLYIHLGILLGLPVFLQANPLFIFYLGRLANFLISFGLFLFAIKKTPPKFRIIPLLILMLPMTLHQMGSYSKDAIHLAAGAIVIAYVLNKWSNYSSFTSWDYVYFFGSLALTILSRPYFLGLSLLSFLIIPLPHMTQKKCRLFVMSSFPLVLGLFILWMIQQQMYVTPAKSKGEGVVSTTIMPEAQLQFIQQYPLQFMKVTYQTLEKELSFLVVSLIGEFGWLDYTLQWYLYIIYSGIIFYVLLKERDDLPMITWKSLSLLLITVGSCLIGTTLAFYLYATPVAESTILGLQGRYFIVLLPILLIILAEMWKHLGKRFLTMVLVFIGLSILISVIGRYYNYTYHYYQETGEHLPALHQVAVTHPLQIKLPITPLRKVTGITVQVSPETNTNQAYKLTILDESCTTTIRETVYPASIFQKPGSLDLIFNHINATSGSMCVQLSPFYPHTPASSPLILKGYIDNNNPIISPVYLY